MKIRYIVFSTSLFFLLVFLVQFYLYKYLVFSEIKIVPVGESATFIGDSAQLNALDRTLLQSLSPLSDPKRGRPVFARNQKGTLQALWVDRCEVTQSSFSLFVDWSKNSPSKLYKHPKTPESWDFKSSVTHHKIASQPDVPVGGVSFYDAYAYCQSAGGRLPTSFEYQAIAMGKDQRLYPWGNDFEPMLWPYGDIWLDSYQSCHQTSKDKTEEGVMHLVSHTAELVWDLNRQVPVIHGFKKASDDPVIFALIIAQQEVGFHERNNYTGFRCVYDRHRLRSPWDTKIDAVNVERGEVTVGMSERSRVPNLINYLDVSAYPIIPALLEKTALTPMQKVMTSEVSVKHYALFLQDPFVRLKFYANINEPKGVDYTPGNWVKQLESEGNPVRSINWWSAYAFANWLGGRLPTETEWIRLYSNGTEAPFPWGEEPLLLGITQEHQRKEPDVLNKKTSDVSAWKVEHLSGNVSEWTSTVQVGPRGTRLIVKGGNFMLLAKDTFALDFALYLLPHQKAPHTGFRVIF